MLLPYFCVTTDISNSKMKIHQTGIDKLIYFQFFTFLFRKFLVTVNSQLFSTQAAKRFFARITVRGFAN